MSVYVDNLFVAESRNFAAKKVGERNGHQWCHMWADEVGELHVFAERLGLRRDWFQPGPRPGKARPFEHYDLTPGKRAMALRLGAVEKDLREWIGEGEQTKRGTQGASGPTTTNYAQRDLFGGGEGDARSMGGIPD